MKLLVLMVLVRSSCVDILHLPHVYSAQGELKPLKRQFLNSLAISERTMCAGDFILLSAQAHLCHC